MPRSAGDYTLPSGTTAVDEEILTASKWNTAFNDISTALDAASQAEAETGSDNTKLMTPLRTAQAMAARVATSTNTGRLARFTNTSGTIGQSLVEDNGSDAWLLPGGWAVRWQGGTGYLDQTGTDIRVRIGGGLATVGVINATGWGLGSITAPERVLHIGVDGSTQAPAIFQANNASGAATSGMTTRAARGTAASPAATQSGDRPFGFFGQSFGGTTWASCVAIAGVASEAHSETARGTHLTFETTANGTTTRTEHGRLDNAGNWGFGTTSPTTKVHSSGPIRHATYTVSGLPSASTVGAGTRAAVTDANATTFNSVVAGGGANFVPVISDGTNWRIG